MNKSISTINTLEELWELIDLEQKKGSKLIYRGVHNSEFQLIPSIQRELNKSNNPIVYDYQNLVGLNQIKDEKHLEYMNRILRNFSYYSNYNGLSVYVDTLYKNVFNHKFKSYSEIGLIDKYLDGYYYPGYNSLDLLSLVQHYGLPTDLLDFTYDFYTALYFSIRGCLYDFNYEEDKNDFFKGYFSIWLVDLGYIDKMNGNLTTFNFPLKTFVGNYTNNPNLNAQKGIFLYWYRKVDSNSIYQCLPIDTLYKNSSHYKEDTFRKINIPKKFIVEVYKKLSFWGYGADRLFPGYSGVESRLRENKIIDLMKKFI
jgi:hypothetical protein